MFETFFENQPDIISPKQKLGFNFGIISLPGYFSDDLKTQLSWMMFNKFVDFGMAAGLRRNVMKFVPPAQAIMINKLNQAQGTSNKTGWAVIKYQEPGKEFSLIFDDENIQLNCPESNLSTLIDLTNKVFSGLLGLFLEDEIRKALQIDRRAHTTQASFSLRIELGKSKVQGHIEKNTNLLGRALGVSAKAGSQLSEANALRTLAVEEYVRSDYILHGVKEFRGNNFNAVTKIEAPYNENGKLLEITAALKMVEQFGFDIEEGINLEIPIIDFYRDVICKRLLANLLCQTEHKYI